MEKIETADSGITVLIVDGADQALASLQAQLAPFGVIAAAAASLALEALRARPVDVVVTEQRLPDSTGAALLSEAARLQPDAARLVLTSRDDLPAAVDLASVDDGVFFVTRPCETDRLQSVVRQAAERARRLREERRQAEALRAGQAASAAQLAAASETEAKLRASDQIFRSLLTASPDGLLLADLDGKLTLASPQLVKMLGYESDAELLGRSLFDFLSPESRDRAAASIADMAAGRLSGALEYEGLRRDGSRVAIEANGDVLRDEAGQPRALFAVVREITARKEVDARLRETELRFQRVFDQAPIGALLTGPDLKFIRANAAFCRMLGYTEAEVCGLTFADITHPDHLDADRAQVARLVAGEIDQYTTDKRYRCKDGRTVWGHLSLSAIRDPGGALVHTLAMVEDITERRAAEAARQAAEAAYRDVFENSPEGIFQSTPEGRYLSVNPAMARIFGYDSPEDMIVTVGDGIARRVHLDPESRARWTRAMEAGGVVEKFEAPNHRKDGSIIWTRTNARAVRDEAGAVRYYEGFLIDITARHAAEEALRESEARYRSIVESAVEGIFQSTHDGRFLSVNPALARMFGYDSPDEMLAAVGSDVTHRLYVHPDDRSRFVTAMETDGVIERFEAPCYRKDGSIIWTRTNARAVRDAAGAVLYYEGFDVDVTALRAAEDALRESELKFRSIVENSTDGLGLINRDLRFAEWNASMERITGLPRAQALGRPAWEVLHQITPPEQQSSEVLARLQQQMGEAVETGASQLLDHAQERWLRPVGGGADRFAHTAFFPIPGNTGSPLGLVVHDLTVRRNAEEALRESEVRYRRLFEDAALGIFQSSLDDRPLAVNPAFARMFGYASPDEVLALVQTVSTQIFADPARRAEMIRLMAADPTQATFEVEYRRKDGSTFRGSLHVRLVKDDAGQPLLVEGMIEDISDRKRAEAALLESQARLEMALEGGQVEIWDWDLEGGRLIFSENLLQQMGYAPGEIPQRAEAITDFIHPDDRARVAVARQAYVEGRTPVYEVECRLQRKSGDYSWVLSRGRAAARAADGHPTRLLGTNVDITARRSLEEALQTAAQEWRTTFDAIRDAVCLLDPEQRIIRCNMAFAELVGRPIHEIIGHRCAEVVHDLGAPPEFCPMAESLRERRRQSVDVRLGERWFEVTVDPVTETADGVETVVAITHILRDITDRKTVEEQIRRFNQELEQRVAARTAELSARTAELEQERRLLRTVIDNIPDRIFAYDLNCLNTLSNLADASDFGVADPKDLLGKPTRDFVPPDQQAAWDEPNVRVMQSGEPIIEVESLVARADGTQHWMLTTKVPLRDSQGHVTGLVGIARDITRHKEAEAALSALNEELKRALRVKDEFLATMSHELRTPLTAVLGQAEALRLEVYGPLQPRQVRPLAAIQESGQHLLSVVNDVLDFANLEAGYQHLDLERVQVDRLCRQSVQSVTPASEKKRLRLTVSQDMAVPELTADGRRLRQVVVNLLNNAIKFTGEGGAVGLEVAAAAGEAETREVRFTVWDTGIGIKPADQPRLFQPFAQLDSRLSRRYEGTGLGLALVQRLVALHHGRVTVESDGVPGHGSRFNVFLPLEGPK